MVDGAVPRAACSIETRVAGGGRALAFDIADFVGCEVDARLANSAFFDLSRYTQTAP